MSQRILTVALESDKDVVLVRQRAQTQWDLDKYPGLLARSPALVAAMLMRDFIRRRDDAMVLVVRRSARRA